jgi:phage terminase large subunit-like protein
VAARAVPGWPPRHCTLSPTKRTRTRGDEAARFIESYCRIVKDSVGGRAGDLIVLRPWQRMLLDALLAEGPDGLLRHRSALLGMARKNGKSALGSGLALWGLFLGPEGGEVYSCAGTKEQAKIVFNTAKAMVEKDPELSRLARPFKDVIEVPGTGSIYRALSREAGASEGLNPTLTVFDEVHVQPDAELWDVMSLADGAREEALVVGITTAGARTNAHGRDSHCYGLYQHGRKVVAGEVEDPTFFFAWWEPKLGTEANHRDPAVWHEGNPGFGDICSEASFRSALPKTSEAEFRTKRTNVWVSSASAALPHGVWDALAEPDRYVVDGEVDPGETPVVLMGDGSWSGDCTGIVAITVEERPHLWVIDLWEKDHDDADWRVPVADVEQAYRDTVRATRCKEAGMDPYRWGRSLQILEGEGLPMVEYPMGSVDRMTRAWKVFYDAVLDRQISHSGDPRLARHIDAMVLKVDAKGARPVKDLKHSERHIDLGVCSVAGVERALWHHSAPVDEGPSLW